MSDKNKIDVCGVCFDNVTASQARERLFSALEASSGSLFLFTPNPEIVMLAEQDDEFADILNSDALVVPDGIGVIKAANILKTPLRERVPGIELGEAMIEYCAKKGSALPVYLLGGKEGVASLAAEKLCEKYAGLCVCGTHNGYFDASGEDNDALINEINEKKPALVLVCLGAPKQEKWIYKNADKLPTVRVFAGLGGSLDVFSGNVKRAPAFFCKCGLEWFYRLLCQPTRIKRMCKLPLFLIKAKKYGKRTKNA